MGPEVRGATAPLVVYNVNKIPSRSFNPFDSLQIALGYGKSLWTKVKSLPLADALPLIDLTFLLEEHIQTLVTLYTFKTSTHNPDDSIISDLCEFIKLLNYQFLPQNEVTLYV